MQVEVINTGTELLLGQVTNSHLAFLGQGLFPLGLRIEYQVSVPDGPAIRDALNDAFRRAEVVLVTGGLGPTSDDITRDIAAELVHRPLAPDPAILETLQAYFLRVGRPMSAAVARQAQVPEGATVLPNAHGTAPGLYLPPTLLPDGRRSPHIFLLPGPPRELRPMFTKQVAPLLQTLLAGADPRPECRIYRAVGIGESMVEELVGPALQKIDGLEIGYCARLGEVDVRCIGDRRAVELAESVVLPALKDYLLPQDVQSVEEGLIRRLTTDQRTLGVAESCTGGMLAHRLTSVTGASAVFRAGITTYAVEAKCALLGVDPALIEQHGVVSAEVAEAMAAGACRVMGVDYALSTTGEAGPDSSGPQPVGTLFIGLSDGVCGTTESAKQFFPMDRDSFKERAARVAFELLRRHLA